MRSLAHQRDNRTGTQRNLRSLPRGTGPLRHSVRQKIRDYSMMERLNERPHGACPRFLVTYEAREHEASIVHAQHEVSVTEHQRTNVQDHPILRSAHNLPTEHVRARSARPEPETESGNPP